MSTKDSTTSSGTTALRADDARFYRLFKQFQTESKAVVLSAIAVIGAAVAVFLSVLAYDSAKTAEVAVNYELEATRAEIEALKNEIETYQIIMMREGITDE